ncbi:hypothetical protein C8246_05925 [Paracidovorax avenae]|nr:hypothetical protein C8246_05925 [Paracidovorax avenae]
MKKIVLAHAAAFCAIVSAQVVPPPLDETVLRSAFKSLKDPNSAQFRDIKYKPNKGGWTMCGEVNAKNSFGAFTGFQRFYGVVSTPSGKANYWVGPVGEIAEQMCTEDGL